MLKKLLLLFALTGLSAFALVGYLRKPLVLDVDNAYVSGRIFKIHAPKSGYVKYSSVLKGKTFDVGGASIVYDQDEIDLEISQQAAIFRQKIEEEIGNCFSLERSLTEYEKLQLESAHREKRYRRTTSIGDKGAFLSPEEVDERISQFEAARKNVDASEVDLRKMRSINRLPILERASVKVAEDTLRKKLHEKALHEISLPFSGYVYETLIFAGKYVKEGDLLAVVVPREEVMIEANVLESSLAGIRPGQPVDIELDTYKGTIYRGYVHGVVPSTAAAFSSLPRNNSDSNWIKVTQRVPVLIRFETAPPADLSLALGASARIRINLNERAKARPPEWPQSGPVDIGDSRRIQEDAFIENLVAEVIASFGRQERPDCPLVP